jgi:hypothetical protein
LARVVVAQQGLDLILNIKYKKEIFL